MNRLKAYITYGVAVLLFIGLIYIFWGKYADLKTPISANELFGQALWNTWGIAVVIVALIIFASGAGILVLLGGKWRWE